jgi:hypothetical protein
MPPHVLQKLQSSNCKNVATRKQRHPEEIRFEQSQIFLRYTSIGKAELSNAVFGAEIKNQKETPKISKSQSKLATSTPSLPLLFLG